jgi:hypothetical protein
LAAAVLRTYLAGDLDVGARYLQNGVVAAEPDFEVAGTNALFHLPSDFSRETRFGDSSRRDDITDRLILWLPERNLATSRLHQKQQGPVVNQEPPSTKFESCVNNEDISSATSVLRMYTNTTTKYDVDAVEGSPR